MEIRICQLPFSSKSCPAKFYAAHPVLTRYSWSVYSSAIVTMIDNMDTWNIYIAFMQSLFTAQFKKKKKEKTGLQGLASCQSYPDLNFIRQEFTPEFKNWKRGWRSCWWWSFVVKESCLLFLWADFQGRYKMTSLKEETTEKHLEILKQK